MEVKLRIVQSGELVVDCHSESVAILLDGGRCKSHRDEGQDRLEDERGHEVCSLGLGMLPCGLTIELVHDYGVDELSSDWV